MRPPAAEKPRPLSPAVRALALALASGRDVAGHQVFSPDAALEVAKAVKALIREEAGLAFGSAAMRLSEPEDRQD